MQFKIIPFTIKNKINLLFYLGLKRSKFYKENVELLFLKKQEKYSLIPFFDKKFTYLCSLSFRKR